MSISGGNSELRQCGLPQPCVRWLHISEGQGATGAAAEWVLPGERINNSKVPDVQSPSEFERLNTQFVQLITFYLCLPTVGPYWLRFGAQTSQSALGKKKGSTNDWWLCRTRIPVCQALMAAHTSRLLD